MVGLRSSVRTVVAVSVADSKVGVAEVISRYFAKVAELH